MYTSHLFCLTYVFLKDILWFMHLENIFNILFCKCIWKIFWHVFYQPAPKAMPSQLSNELMMHRNNLSNRQRMCTGSLTRMVPPAVLRVCSGPVTTLDQQKLPPFPTLAGPSTVQYDFFDAGRQPRVAGPNRAKEPPGQTTWGALQETTQPAFTGSLGKVHPITPAKCPSLCVHETHSYKIGLCYKIGPVMDDFTHQ